jgi:hypothetical protein
VLTLLAAACLQAQVPITIASNPPGASFSVAGSGCSPGTYTAPATLIWTPPALICTVTFASTQTGTQYVLTNWQDGPTSNPRTFVSPAQATTYTANVEIQYLLTTLANPTSGGTVSGSGWYDSGLTATVTATPGIGYRFTGWVGASSSGTPSNTATLTMNSPQTVTANFVSVPLGSYVVTQIATNVTATSLNNFGQVVGTATASNGSLAFLWTPTTANGQSGSITVLAPSTGSAAGINDSGQVVGMLGGLAFLWSPTSANGTSGSLVAFLGNAASGSPGAINNFGQIAGSFGIWTPSTANGTSGTLNQQLNGVVEINDFGQAIMNVQLPYPPCFPEPSNICPPQLPEQINLFTPSVPHGSSGSFTPIATGWVAPVAISKAGAILGEATPTTHCSPSYVCALVSSAWVWTPSSANGTSGATTYIPIPANCSSMLPSAFNASGLVVGLGCTSAPFLYTGGVIYDLGVLSGQLAGGTAVAINDVGQIVVNANNNVYLLTPGPPQPPASLAVSPQSGTGQSQIMTFTFTDPRGWQDLDVENILINNFLDGRNACYLAYSRSAGVLYLVPDAGGGLLPAITLGGSGSTSNSQCSVASTGSSANGSGNTLTLTLNLTFSASFGGNKVIYMAAGDVAGDNSGWQPLGVWSVPGAPQTTTTAVVGMAPASGNGVGPVPFAFTFSDTKGIQDFGVQNILVNGALDGRGACYLAYARPYNVLFLMNDGGTALLPGQSMAAAGALSNSQCTVSWGAMAVSTSGNNLTVNLSISFSAAFDGNRIFFLASRDLTDANNTGWQAMGTFTVQ